MPEYAVAMNIEPGIELVEETEGIGNAAKKGDRVVYNIRIFLNRGDEVPINEEQVKQSLPTDILRRQGDRVFVDHQTTLGKRRSIAGIERSLIGMKPGGYRKIRLSPHLAYGEKGIPDLIPANAVLVIEIWLRELHADA
jgi:FKBP-type peptidyl-prolyl cis-trans isomerase (trigger factor)